MEGTSQDKSLGDARLQEVLGTPPYLKAMAAIAPLKLRAPLLEGRLIRDCFGGVTRRSFASMPDEVLTRHGFGQVTDAFVPSFSEDYFDWLDLLESAAEGTDPYVFVELGAGYGRWAAHAANLCRAMGRPLGALVACEAEPTHFRWMMMHLQDNGVDPAKLRMIQAVVAGQRGEVPFYVGAAAAWYGQSIAQNVIDYGSKPGGSWGGLWRRLFGREKFQERVEMVPAVILADILTGLPKVHFMHIDIQGAEFDVLKDGMDLLTERVRRIHVGTHAPTVEVTRGRDMDRLIGDLFAAYGWECHVRIAPEESRRVFEHDINFVDGVQIWLNPHA